LEVCAALHFWETTTAKGMNEDRPALSAQWQNCCALNIGLLFKDV